MKTTIEVPDQLFRRAKVKAALEGCRLTDLVTEGLQYVVGRPAARPAKRLKFPLLKAKGKVVLEIPNDAASLDAIADDVRRYEESMRY